MTTAARTGTPTWVGRIVKKTRDEFQPKRRVPTVVWRWSRGGEIGRPNAYSTGHCNYTGRIVVTAGTNLTDQKFVVLHELAHWLTPYHGHDEVFWDACLMMTKRFGMTRKEILACRDWRMNGLKLAAKRLRAKGKTRPIAQFADPVA